MIQTQYEWKMPKLSYGIDPNIAMAELRKLQDLYGSIKPEIIVKEAANPESPLHPYIYSKDDKRAAYLYRLDLARKLLNNIQLVVIKNDEVTKISVFEITTNTDGYKSFDSFTPDDIEFVKLSVKKQLLLLRNKLSLYDNFKDVIKLIDAASNSLDAVLVEIEEKRRQPISLSNKD
jgi:hypothetical protein